jgi:hypothetical protein
MQQPNWLASTPPIGRLNVIRDRSLNLENVYKALFLKLSQ